MKVWKDKQGNKLTRKEFMQRWKQGIQKVTPLQQINIQIRSTQLMLLGIFCGIVIALFNLSKLWWVLIILLGVMGVTSIQLLGQIQKRNALKNLEQMLKGGLKND